MAIKIEVAVRGGYCVRRDLFACAQPLPAFACAIADPPYGGNVGGVDWDKISGEVLATKLTSLLALAQVSAIHGAHFWLWGGTGTPGNRALYSTLLRAERETEWRMAEQITWSKKRGYGTDWRCLYTREECLRFVYGDVRKPHVYHPQYTDEVRGYAGFNPLHPAKSANKRLTAIWSHASDMTQNKPSRWWKPPALARSQILSCTDPGDRVLDLFACSGEVSLVARELDRPFVAYENDAEQFDKLVERLNQ
jgi:DNA modification methylase